MPARVGFRVRRLFFRRGVGIAAVVVAMALAVLLATRGLDHQLFWDDEANTAIYGRNLLRFGRLTAWDGTNLIGYSFGGALGDDLGQELRVAPLPSFVAAAGLYLFGGTADDVTTYRPEVFGKLTFAARFPFVVLGVLSLAMVAVWLRRHFGPRFPWWLPPLILALSPAYLLYIRNCRYYALGVMLSVAVWMFWAPGAARAGRTVAPCTKRGPWIARCVGAALATVLLIFTHYLNAASLLATLPLFFLDSRYRQRRQYHLLGVIYGAAACAGVWILLTANPFAADYQEGGLDHSAWEHFYTNVAYFIRDMGVFEFVPWVAVAAFVLPWLPRRMRRLRPLAFRAWILVGLVLAYAVLAGLFTPSDMGKGGVAEIRYVVPMTVVGSVLGSLAVAILWQWYRATAGVCLLLLCGTNFLHLGFLANRLDDESTWWPPMIVRYVDETFHDFETGNEEFIGLLAQLPEGTTVRGIDTVLIYPAMFYVPTLHYCDQLDKGKKVRPELGPMPEYLYHETAKPDVVFFQPEMAYWVEPMHEQIGEYRLTAALSRFFGFMGKPEIPAHFFSYPEGTWHTESRLSVLVRTDSPLWGNPHLSTDVTDAAALARWGTALADIKRIDEALEKLHEAARIDPDCFEAQKVLGFLLWKDGESEEAADHFRTAVRLNPLSADAHMGYGWVLRYHGELERAKHEFETALKIQPDSPLLYYNLGQVYLDQGAVEEAIRLFEKAVEMDHEFADAYVEHGLALYMLGRTEEAITQYRRAIKLEWGNPAAHANLGIALLNQAAGLPKNEAERADEYRRDAVINFANALQELSPTGKKAQGIRQLIEEQMFDALRRDPPNESLAEMIREILERIDESEQSKSDDDPQRPNHREIEFNRQRESSRGSISK